MKAHSVLLVLALLLAPVCGQAETEPSMEFQLRASYIYHFTKFVRWPAQVLGGSGELDVCVVGRDPFGWALQELDGQRAASGVIRIHRYADPAEAVGCEVQYFALSAGKERRRALAGLSGKPVFTIGEDGQFLGDGGILRFLTVEDRIRFEIGTAALQKTGLRVSARLLNVAILK